MHSLKQIPLLLCLVGTIAAQNYWFSFGDSYTATAFDRQGTQATVTNPIGNPVWNYSLTWQNAMTTAGGPNYIDWLITQYASSPLLNANFAAIGATIDNNVANSTRGPIAFLDQVSTMFMPQYASTTGPVGNWRGDNTLFTMGFGINDINTFISQGKPASTQVPLAMQSYMNGTDQLYRSGGRHFVFINCPAYDKSSTYLAAGPGLQQQISNYVTAFNAALAQNATQFQNSHPGSTVSVYDAQGFMNKVVASPSAYGMKNATCEGAGYSQCIWWQNSDLHPTASYHRYYALDMANSGKFGTFFTANNPPFPAAITNATSASAFCPTDNNEVYTASTGDHYLMKCGYSWSDSSTTLQQTSQLTLAACVESCSSWNTQHAGSSQCLGVNYYGPAYGCFLKSSLASPYYIGWDAAILMTTSSASSSMVPSVPSSTAASIASSSPTMTVSCPASNGTQYNDAHGGSYNVLCGYTYSGSYCFETSGQPDTASCLQHCTDYNVQAIAAGTTQCAGATYGINQQVCYLVSNTSGGGFAPNNNSGGKASPIASISSSSPASAAMTSSTPASIPLSSPSASVPSSSPTSTVTCPASNGTQYRDSHGGFYGILCGYTYSGAYCFETSGQPDTGACLQHCTDWNAKAGSGTQQCAGATYGTNQQVCYLVSNTTGGGLAPNNNSGGKVSLATTITCPASNGTQFGDAQGGAYGVLCGYSYSGTYLLESSGQPDTATCLQHCTDWNTKATPGALPCAGATYGVNQQVCYLVSNTTGAYLAPSNNSGGKAS